MFNQKRRNRFGGFPLFRASGYRSQCGLKRPSPPLSAQYSRAMRQHGLFALLATGGAFSFQTSSNQIMRLLSVMARQRTNEGLRLRRTITKPEPEKPMIWRIVPGILTPVTFPPTRENLVAGFPLTLSSRARGCAPYKPHTIETMPFLVLCTRCKIDTTGRFSAAPSRGVLRGCGTLYTFLPSMFSYTI